MFVLHSLSIENNLNPFPHLADLIVHILSILFLFSSSTRLLLVGKGLIPTVQVRRAGARGGRGARAGRDGAAQRAAGCWQVGDRAEAARPPHHALVAAPAVARGGEVVSHRCDVA